MASPSLAFPKSIVETPLAVFVHARGMLVRLVGDFVLNMLDRIESGLLAMVRYEEQVQGQDLILVEE